MVDPLETRTAVVHNGRSPYVQTRVSRVKIIVIRDYRPNRERNENANILISAALRNISVVAKARLRTL